MNSNLFNDQFINLSEWVQNHSRFPKHFDGINLARYLKASELDLEEAKKLFVSSLEWRRKYPHIFTNRDPHLKEFKNLVDIIQYVPLPERTPKCNCRVTVVRLLDSDPEKIIFDDVIKMFFMLADIRLASVDEFWSDGEIPIWDMENISYRHFGKISLSTLRLFLKYTQNAHPVKVRQLHVINCNSLLNKALSLVKPFLKSEVAERIHFHTPNSETLYHYIPKEILPNELGGSYGSISELQETVYEYLDNYRDYLMKDENWKLS